MTEREKGVGPSGVELLAGCIYIPDGWLIPGTRYKVEPFLFDAAIINMPPKRIE